MSISLAIAGNEHRIKTTVSRCPVCLAEIAAEVVELGGRVVLRKVCVEHGRFEVDIAAGRRFYFDSRGAGGAVRGGESCCSGGACCAPAGQVPAPDADAFDVLPSCIALIEIVDSCNLTCPTCFASSPLGVNGDVTCSPFDDVVRRVQGVIDRKGPIDILQLSGGEPTIHPEFFRILRWAIENERIGYILINTNAVRIATDAAFREELGALRREHARFELYVQFDGVQEAGQAELRGADLRRVRERAIDTAGALGVPSTLAMVVTPATLGHLGEAVRFGLARPHVRGICFQPMFTSGRVPMVESSTLPVRSPRPISVGDVIMAVAAQSENLLAPEDFTPLPCGDPNCHTISYMLRGKTPDEAPVALSRLIDVASYQGFLSDRIDYRLEDLATCGCESEPLAELLKGLEIGPERPFRIFIKPFMDAWTFDQDRIDRCCTHVIRRDGSLDSFCRYYLSGGGAADPTPMARGV